MLSPTLEYVTITGRSSSSRSIWGAGAGFGRLRSADLHVQGR